MSDARPFEFVPFGVRAPDGALCCDGLVDGETIHLSHWPRNKTAARWKADTSVEIALRYAEQGEAGGLVTNNHFDTDGVLAVFSLVNPEVALAHRDVLVAAAEVGDFDEWPADDRGVQLDFAVRAIAASANGDAGAYARVLGELPDVLRRPDAHAPLWEKPWARLNELLREARDGAVAVTQHGAIAVFAHREGTEEMPGPVLSRIAPAGCTRWLLAFDRGGGRWDYRYERVRWAWADTVVRPIVEAPSRNAIAARLGSGWIMTGDLGMTGILRSDGVLAITPDEVAAVLAA
jgi:hypothetical protein